MSVKLKVANFLAKYSLPKWNRRRFLRVLCRWGYREMGEYALRIATQPSEAQAFQLAPARVSHFRSRQQLVYNTYPWPYSDPDFAAWPEEDEGQNYTLVSDPSGFVIRRSASYCAWKLRELTHAWPKVNKRQRYDAKDWQEFLALLGFDKVVPALELSPSHYYVGILPHVGEFGLVVWFEGLEFKSYQEMPRIVASTYQNFHFTLMKNLPNETIWVQIL